MSQLAIKAGPMLKYDSVSLADYKWHGFALIVTEDAKSDYSVTPTLRLRWQPFSGDADVNGEAKTQGEGAVVPQHAQSTSQAIKLHEYATGGSSFTFWRFKLEVPMSDSEQKVTYSLDGTAHPDSQPPAITEATSNSFFVPSKTQDFRWISHSCNGFSASLNPDDFGGPNPLWDDVVKEHQKRPFHAVVGGGDQIYNDKLTQEPEMQEWVKCTDSKKRMAMPLTQEMSDCIDRYLFNHYCEWFGSGTFSKVIASVPMMNMLDDHDLIDGFGTYPDDLMMAHVFNAIGTQGYFWYLIFQQFMKMEVDGKDDSQGKHSHLSVIIGPKGPYIPFPNQSFLAYMGPKQWLLMIDCRAERKVDQVCTKEAYDKIFSRVQSDIPAGTEHLVILLGVPLAYPRMVFLERALSSPFNPLIMLAKGIKPGFANSFNGQVELLDDLNDHWCAAGHKKERNALVCRVQEAALAKHLRVSWMSGDVHCASVSCFYGYRAHDPALDPKFSLAVVTSAIVNAAPPPPVINLLNKLGKKKHRSLFYAGTKETMVELFDGKDKYVRGSRNWCAVTRDPSNGDLEFQLRLEETLGKGDCKAYPVRAPAPKWQVPKEHHHLLHTKAFGAHNEKTSSAAAEAKKSSDPVVRATSS